jgi:hypothetical protein
VEILKQLCEIVHVERSELGQMIGFTTVTMLQLTGHNLSSSFWPKNRLLKWITHPVPNLALNDFWLFPNIKSALKGRRFQDIEGIQNKCDNGTETYSITGVPEMFPRMIGSLG